MKQPPPAKRDVKRLEALEAVGRFAGQLGRLPTYDDVLPLLTADPDLSLAAVVRAIAEAAGREDSVFVAGLRGARAFLFHALERDIIEAKADGDHAAVMRARQAQIAIVGAAAPARHEVSVTAGVAPTRDEVAKVVRELVRDDPKLLEEPVEAEIVEGEK